MDTALLDRTRQQTLTQIDFVKLLAAPPDDDLEYSEWQEQPTKRRRIHSGSESRSAKRSKSQKTVIKKESDQNSTMHDSKCRRPINPSGRRSLSAMKFEIPETPHKPNLREVYSSQSQLDGQSSMNEQASSPSLRYPFKEKSVNVPSLPAALVGKRCDAGGVPKLKVESSCHWEFEPSQMSDLSTGSDVYSSIESPTSGKDFEAGSAKKNEANADTDTSNPQRSRHSRSLIPSELAKDPPSFAPVRSVVEDTDAESDFEDDNGESNDNHFSTPMKTRTSPCRPISTPKRKMQPTLEDAPRQNPKQRPREDTPGRPSTPLETIEQNPPHPSSPPADPSTPPPHMSASQQAPLQLEHTIDQFSQHPFSPLPRPPVNYQPNPSTPHIPIKRNPPTTPSHFATSPTASLTTIRSSSKRLQSSSPSLPPYTNREPTARTPRSPLTSVHSPLIDSDTTADVTISQLLPESLMDSLLPPPPELSQETVGDDETYEE
ncbi:MAG: hypothetical protein M1833_003042 [Piccolia ochrophora]|nr:MAG: hypothetical protein M1833_003042 [Piccolia ochrophora]